MTVPTILAVDDSSDDLMLLELACGAAQVQFNLRTVRSGEAAMAYLDGRQEYADRARFPFPRLLLLDLKMPRISGFAVLAWARAASRYPLLPIVVFTSSVQSEDHIRAVELGANAFVAKPIGFEALQQFVRALDHLLASPSSMPDLRRLELAAQPNTLSSGPSQAPALPGA